MPSYPNPFRTTTARAPQDMLSVFIAVSPITDKYTFRATARLLLLLFATPTPTALLKLPVVAVAILILRSHGWFCCLARAVALLQKSMEV